MHLVCDMLRGPVFAAGVAAAAREGVNVSAGWQLDKKITYDSAGMSVKQITLDHTHYDTIDGCNACTELYGVVYKPTVHEEIYPFEELPRALREMHQNTQTGIPDRPRRRADAGGGAGPDPLSVRHGAARADAMQAAFCSGPGRLDAARGAGAGARRRRGACVRVRACGICGSDLHWFHGGVAAAGGVPRARDRRRGRRAAAPAVTAVARGRRGWRSSRWRPAARARCCRSGDPAALPAACASLGMHAAGRLRRAAWPCRPTTLYPLPAELDWRAGGAERADGGVRARRAARRHRRSVDRVLVLGAGTIGLLRVSRRARPARPTCGSPPAIRTRQRRRVGSARRGCSRPTRAPGRASAALSREHDRSTP